MTLPRAALAAFCVAALLPGCSLRGSVRDAAVVLTAVRDAYVNDRPAADGERLNKGDRVRTGPHGTVALGVRRRVVLLGGATEVVVPDGAAVSLTRGAILVDRRHGPGLTVTAGETTVDQIGTGAVRIQRSYVVTVAGLGAPSRVRTPTGQQRSLPSLYAITVAGRSPLGEKAPLRLRHDAWERRVLAAVVDADSRLNQLAEGIDAGTVSGGRAGVAGPTSETALPEAIGRAGASSAADAASRTAAARALRAEGGSWGVVAALLDATAVDVGSALALVLRGVPIGVGPSTGPGSSPSTGPGSGTPSPSTSGGPSPSSGSPNPTPTTSSPTPDPVQSVIDTARKLLPTPVPSLQPGVALP